ncbi:MAG: hypothetical protein ABJN40_00725 [Sneathiella sp.]
MTVSDQEWDRLNAYSDGELSAEDTRAFKLLLASRSDLRQEYQRLMALKASLATLKPAPVTQSEGHKSSKRLPLRRLAASVLFAGSLAAAAALYVSNQSSPPSALALHASFSSNTYVLSAGNPKLLVSGMQNSQFGIPDLSASALTLADVKTLADQSPPVVAMHYRGQRGCRVTLVATGRISASKDKSSENHPDILFRVWRSEDFKFTLLATGMDRVRFQSIAEYAIENTGRARKPDLKNLEIAMQQSYENARPCA